jgi:hypothetical protein
MTMRLPALFSAAFAVSWLASASQPLPDDWAFRPVTRPPVPGDLPASSASEDSKNPVDQFIRATLRQRAWKPGREADRRVLIRRVCFDLIGLPPTPEEIEVFLRDKRPDAFDHIVDRLLASPQYGERWARHWLDVVRFGESQGFEYDRIRDHAWRYRDYVINAFNADKPYDRFIREQLAGDVIEPVTQEGIVATGFLVAGPWDQAGNSSASPSVRAMVREAELEDMLGTIGQTFLGVTLNCARCHNHKFDPIPTRDYYRIKAVFQGVRHGDRRVARDGATNLCYAANPEQPTNTFVLRRGEPDKSEDQVRAGALSAVKLPTAELGLNADAPEGERRRRFANWITHPDNPLTARVIVNRVWHYHFGRGLVATPNDLGKMGERPAHPELLDWLARWFVSPDGANWSLKRLHRLIVTSEAWRSPSESVISRSVISKSVLSDARGSRGRSTNSLNTDLLITDSLITSFRPRRLEAEAVRDAMLFVSGELNPQMGGPGFRPFEARGNGNQNEYFSRDPIGPEFNRRTVYRICVHSARDPLLDSLDCPEFSTRTAVRPSTTTPLQALSLMNSSFVQRQARKLAERVKREVGDEAKAQAKSLWLRCYAREPRSDELRAATRLVREEGLGSLAWAVLNSNEFVFLR